MKTLFEKMTAVLIVVSLAVPAGSLEVLAGVPAPSEQTMPQASSADAQEQAQELIEKKNVAAKEEGPGTAAQESSAETSEPSAEESSEEIPVTPESFIADLQANGYSEAFNLLFGTSIPEAGAATPEDLGFVADFVGAPDFDSKKFMGDLPKAGEMLETLQKPENAESLADFNNVYGASIPAEGTPALEDTGKIFGVIGSFSDEEIEKPVFFEVYFGNLSKVSDLVDLTRADEEFRVSLENIHGWSIDVAAAFADEVIAEFFGAAAYSGYVDAATFAVETKEASGLIDVIRPDEALISAIANLTGLVIASTGVLADEAIAFLYATVGDPLYISPETYATETKEASGLLDAARADDKLRLAITNVFGFLIPRTGPVPARTLEGLYSIVAFGGYALEGFSTEVVKVSDLWTVAKTKPAVRYAINNVFDLDLKVGLPLSDKAIAALFGIASDPLYVQTTFVLAVVKVSSLFDVAKVNPAVRYALNNVFSLDIKIGLPLSIMARTALFGIVGGAGYVQKPFVIALVKASTLYDALKGIGAVKLTIFNDKYGTAIVFPGSLSPADIAILFSIVSTSGYSLKVLLAGLTAATLAAIA